MLHVPRYCLGVFGAIVAVSLLLPTGALAGPAARPTVAGSPAARPQCPPLPSPADFVRQIDNPYLPLLPGTTFIYAGQRDGQPNKDTVEVTHDTRVVLGIVTTAVRDIVTTPSGAPVESTIDWYAQDKDGNVWYFGEASVEFNPISFAGSWLGGHNGAQPSIIMEAHPHVGDVYRQECAAGVAEDMAAVQSLDESVTVPYGAFQHALLTKEWSPLEPSVVENKDYALCVGMVKSVVIHGGSESSELVEVRSAGTTGQPGGTCAGGSPQ